MLLLGHRGASASAPENTEPAFRAAIAIGADGVELDVHLTKDLQMVICHNFDIGACSDGQGRIADLTLSELKRLDFGGWKNVRFAGTPILTLEEALSVLKGMSLINIEMKSEDGCYPSLPGQACALVKKMGLTDRVILSSFNHSAAMACKKHLPKVRVGLLYRRPYFCPVSYARRLGADALHPHVTLVTPGLIRRCHAAGLAVNTWTVDRPRVLARLARWGCDAAITNFPDIKY